MTPKQQRFVHAYLETGNATQAYISAGYSKTGADGNAARLIGKDSIQAAIAKAQAKAEERHEITRERMAEMMREDREFARKLEQPGAAATASMNLARLMGYITNKHQHTVDPLSDVYNMVNNASKVARNDDSDSQTKH